MAFAGNSKRSRDAHKHLPHNVCIARSWSVCSGSIAQQPAPHELLQHLLAHAL
jgi:hypothetical protein